MTFSAVTLAGPAARIGTLNEAPLHADLKAWYAEPGDRLEVPLEGRHIDLVRGELLVEIQTRGFSALRAKLSELLARHPVRLVHPIAAEKWIVRVDGEGRVLGRRRSPRRGRLEDVFGELVSLPRLLLRPNFSCEVLLVQEEEVRRHAPGPEAPPWRSRRAWRRKGWVVVERRLVAVLERRLLRGPSDLLQLLPSDLPSPFTTADLATRLEVTRDLAQKMAYCLREVGAIETRARGRAGCLYRLAPEHQARC